MIDGKRESVNARDALKLAGLSTIILMPKEGLRLINGTAVSTTAASLVLHETQILVLCSQALTGMATEGLRGSADNYHPLISHVRPHSGQTEVASNIARFLAGSQLIVGKTKETTGLYQDRYGLRTAPQWLGPQLEDIGLAIQIRIELNATTDNPLIDAEDQIVHHGGNFPAVSITSAMEKTRLALQMLGRFMFAQCSELINPTLNDHLPSNLCFDDPGVSFALKGIDINMAAYMSELALLVNPVSSHVQSAVLHNQAVNSLALISSRYTMDAVELTASQSFNNVIAPIFDSSIASAVLQDVLSAIRVGLRASRNSSAAERARDTAEATIVPLTKAALQHQDFKMCAISQFVDSLTKSIATAIFTTRLTFASPAGPPTLQYLSRGSAVLYRFIRHDLGVPLPKGLVEHPSYPESSREGIEVPHEERHTIGSRVGVIYPALRSGRFGRVVLESLS